ncbi:MAG: phosphoenolpyruvate carboxylase [Mariniblastus sp.]
MNTSAQPDQASSESNSKVPKNIELGETIRLLGGLLGQTIIDQEGNRVFEMEEDIRKLAIAWRSGDESAKERLSEIIPKLVDDLPLASANLKAFSTYFQLVNLAEERERVRVLRQRAESAFQSNEAMDETIGAALGTLKREGITAEQFQAILKTMAITPVFTAHPTESKRRTIRQILNKVSVLLQQTHSKDLFEHERHDIGEILHDYIVLLWQSDETRNRRPTVMDEVRNSGLYFFENTLFDLIPRIYEELENALQEIYPDFDFEIPSFLTYGSWIGGDRDGNPYVTTQVTEDTLREHKDHVLKRYSSEVISMYELLSPSITRAEFSQPFLDSLEEDKKLIPEDEFEVLDRFGQEPYRQKFIMIYRRLKATLEQNKLPWESEPNPRAYESADGLLHDLYLIRDSLLAANGKRLVRGKFARLIRSVEVFGFHMATLDIRQHARHHRAASNEIFAINGTVTDYAVASEEEKIKILTTELESPRSWTGGRKADGGFGFSEETNSLLTLFRLVRRSQDAIGPEATKTYIISMTEGVSNMLEVLLLARDAELFGRIDIVPLFETVDDLKAAPKIMGDLFANPAYAKHLKQRGGQQQIMIGYSDSNKDGGYLRANWMLFTAQRQVAEVCHNHDVMLTLFHGRGGSLGRGGGPANRAILAQPTESVRGRIRITEQGEVVSSRYSEPEIAHRHLQQLMHAVLCSTGTRPTVNEIDQWSSVMDSLSQSAYEKYRSLVERDDFLAYFQTASPIDQIGKLNIGSRPSHRRATQTLDDLRAIPWVFAWTQTRTDVPSWYGVGTGFETWLSDGNRDERLNTLQEMYKSWPFFRTLLGNVHLGMGRADMAISHLYASLAGAEGQAVFADIKSEFELSQKHVLQITGGTELLHTEPWLQHSIRVRNPYVDPLNYIQVELLKRLRAEPEGPNSEAIRHALLQSVNGIAAGLQNVG